MGYYTSYKFMLPEDGPSEEYLADVLARLNEDNPHIWRSIVRNDYEAFKWYEHDTHMRQIAKHWPNVVLGLRGTGEDPGDQWVSYYCGDKYYTETQPKWITPPYDKTKLRRY